jgi:DNA (cytosine-5)-methyltransferase 1
MNVLDLFSGIGGFSVGLERAGMRTIGFCEIDPFCQKILTKHWPDVPCYGDIRTLTARDIRARPDVIAGGFPCQDVSLIGKGAGLSGARSGLWKEYARLIGEIRPNFVIVENVTALLGRGFGDVLGDLAALGYDAEWHCIPASAVGARHRRDRVWVVAYPIGARLEGHAGDGSAGRRPGQDGPASPRRLCDGEFAAWQWDAEPDMGRVAHGVPNRVDRLKSLGNAIVPRIAEIIGRAIMKAHST